MDYGFLIPPGVGIRHGPNVPPGDQPSVSVWTNTPGNIQPSYDWTISDVDVEGRTVFATFTGGIEGTDYQIRWVVTDTHGNVWPRTGLILCAQTS
jgi:hypothetical protein